MANLTKDGLDGEKSGLFFEYLRLLQELKPTYFLLENVKMKKEEQKKISELLGVEPININSNLVSAQNRNRLYWTNIPNITIPQDKNIVL
jgi:DNA (cytosine-5)-methyltransferase 3A